MTHPFATPEFFDRLIKSGNLPHVPNVDPSEEHRVLGELTGRLFDDEGVVFASLFGDVEAERALQCLAPDRHASDCECRTLTETA